MRKPRFLLDGARYHVTARAHRRAPIFAHVADKNLFLQVLVRAKKKFAFRLENFCLLSNHFHAILQPRPGTSLSRILQWILSVFAQAWNRRHRLSDRVWGPRFFSRVLDGIANFFQTFRYIEANPVKAQLVTDASRWPFGRLGLASRGYGDLVDPLEDGP